MTRELAKSGEGSNDIGNYPVLASSQRIGTLLRDALNGEALQLSDLDRIAIPGAGGTTWTVLRGGEEVDEKELRGIILHHQVTRVYFSQPYGSTAEKVPPDCFSRDGVHGEGIPGGDCNVCPMNEWGSKGDSKGKACAQRRIIFLLMEGDYLPVMISAPPSSLQASRKYMLGLVREGKRHTDVITGITLSKEKNQGGIAYGEMRFRSLGALDSDMARKVDTYGRYLAALLSGAQGTELVDTAIANQDEEE
jgi:hypothetical protein